MSERPDQAPLDEQIGQWRAYLRRRRAIDGPDVEELEAHLRDQVGVLTQAGLAEDEAFLIAVKRMGSLDALSQRVRARALRAAVEAARHRVRRRRSARDGRPHRNARRVCPSRGRGARALAGLEFGEENGPFYARNMSLFVLPFLTGYFVWKRRMELRRWAWLAVPLIAAAVVVNTFPFARRLQQVVSDTEALSAMHLPIALWLIVGLAYVWGRWVEGGGRMDFVRFSGELFIYYVLIALGGGVLTAFTMMMFAAIGLQPEWIAQDWLIPCGAMGAVLVGSWLLRKTHHSLPGTRQRSTAVERRATSTTLHWRQAASSRGEDGSWPRSAAAPLCLNTSHRWTP